MRCSDSRHIDVVKWWHASVTTLPLGGAPPTRGCEGGFGVNTCVRYSFDRVLSIEAIGSSGGVVRCVNSRHLDVVKWWHASVTTLPLRGAPPARGS